MASLFMLKNWPSLYCVVAILLNVLLNIILLTNILSKDKTLTHNFAWLKNRKVFENSLYEVTNKSLSVLSELNPRPGSIFFVETSGATDLMAKQSCAIESTARHHPNRQIYLLMTSPVANLKDGPLSYLSKNLTNLQIKYLNVDSFIEGTPLETLWKKGAIMSSIYLVSHLSDVIRFLVLHRFGGTYLDSDIITLKPLPHLTNFIGRESWTHPFIAAGVMQFEHGHPILEEFVQELASHFDGQDWGANGPKLVTRVLQRFCKTEDLSLMSPNKCLGITVLPPEAFYPIPWRQWKEYFTEGTSMTDSVLKKLGHSYIAHVWGKHSSNAKFQETTNVYSVLAQKHCPVTYNRVD